MLNISKFIFKFDISNTLINNINLITYHMTSKTVIYTFLNAM